VRDGRRIVYELHDDHVAELLEQVVSHVEHLRLGLAGRSAAAELETALGSLRVVPLPVPHDCIDGFLGAYWRRPEAYLDAGVRNAMSTFARLGPDAARSVAQGLARLAEDLASGRWEARFGHLRAWRELDLGYRLLVAECGRP